ncbi:MAG: hypothetical protein HC817_07685 [Saprospiraceae bacterium]|nr:hypothetical protein [Saprospiraceae bacterium]
MNNRIILSLIFLAIISIAKAQNEVPTHPKYGFNIGYFGHKIANAGLQIGVEKYLVTTNNFNVIGSLNVSYYNQKDIQSAFVLNGRIGQRYTTGFGLFLETYLGLGLQQTFYTNKTYEYPSGEQSKNTESKEAKTGISPSIVLGLGYDFSKNTELPIKLYIRPTFNWVYPDKNLVFQGAHALELGVIYVPNFKKLF